MSQEGSETATIDGRRMRTMRNRRRIIDALIQAVNAGDFSPGAEEIADAAGVGLRSVFRHFKDMESLYREVGEEFMAQIEPLMSKPLAGDNWQELLDSLIVRKSELMQAGMNMFLFSRMQRHESHYIRIEQEKSRALERKVLIAVLPERLNRDKDLLEALDLALSMDSWARLRKEQGLSVRRSLAVVRRTVAGLMASAES